MASLKRKVLPVSFFDRAPEVVARELLGTILFRRTAAGRTAGRIVETEAYLAANDPASHAFRGMTRRNASMFGRPGRAYVYAIHSRYCMNAVTQSQGIGSAVLIRAVEPVQGLPLMQERRKGCAVTNLTCGPARLCEAFAIDRDNDSLLLSPANGLWIEAGDSVAYEHVAVTPRIGVMSAQDLLLRFIDITSDCLSRPYRVR